MLTNTLDKEVQEVSPHILQMNFAKLQVLRAGFFSAHPLKPMLTKDQDTDAGDSDGEVEVGSGAPQQQDEYLSHDQDQASGSG